jgi:hypothetical protein
MNSLNWVPRPFFDSAIRCQLPSDVEADVPHRSHPFADGRGRPVALDAAATDVDGALFCGAPASIQRDIAFACCFARPDSGADSNALTWRSCLFLIRAWCQQGRSAELKDHLGGRRPDRPTQDSDGPALVPPADNGFVAAAVTAPCHFSRSQLSGLASAVSTHHRCSWPTCSTVSPAGPEMSIARDAPYVTGASHHQPVSSAVIASCTCRGSSGALSERGSYQPFCNLIGVEVAAIEPTPPGSGSRARSGHGSPSAPA